MKQAQQNPIIFNKSQQGRRGDRGHELSNFPRTGRRVCLARGAEDYWLALHDSHRTHETRNLAAPRRARPRPRLAVSSSSRTLAHRTGRCARTAAPGRGDDDRAPGRAAVRPEVGRAGPRFPTASRPTPVRDRFCRRPLPCAGVRLMLMPRQLLVCV